MDIFTRMIHGIRLKYAAVCVVFLAVAVTLIDLGGTKAFGWYGFFAVFTLVLMVLTLFLMHCHYVLSPVEKLSALIHEQIAKSQDGMEPVRIPWSGKDEFACLAASTNGLLEAIQNRSLGLLEENRHLRNVIACVNVELVVMNGAGTVLNIAHCPPGMEPVPGLSCGSAPDPSVWDEKSRGDLRSALKSVGAGGGAQEVNLTFRAQRTNRMRRIKALVRQTKTNAFPVVVFGEDSGEAPLAQPSVRKVPLSRVAAGVSHELQNIFGIIRSSTARYADSKNPEVRDTIATIHRAIADGMVMMENLLTLGGEKRMNLRPVTVQELIDEVKLRVSELTQAGRVRVDYEVADGQCRLLADVQQLGKVMGIVVSNSMEAFGAIPGRVLISTKAVELTNADGAGFCPRQAAGRGILLRIEDDGPGMPANVLQKAFEPYFSTKANGRGLGLAIADSIVEAHGGGMRLDSEKGERTAVEIFLRLSERAAEDLELLRKEFPGGEVLVVDDNRSVLKITSALLRTQQIAAHVADCRADALRKFGELSGRIRAVLLDAQLGDETSVGILQNMRDIDDKVPVIVVSGYTKGEIDALFYSTPPDGYLMKPYTVSELKEQLEKV